jgi:O-antigen chain-terminating methyltransferase
MSSQPVLVEEIMRDIRDRIRKRGPTNPAADFVSSTASVTADLDQLRASLSALRAAEQSLDSLPPEPPTARGAIGGRLSRFIRRALFWQYSQARSFASGVVGTLDRIQSCLANISQHVDDAQNLHKALGGLSKTIESLTASFQNVREDCQRLLKSTVTLEHSVATLNQDQQRNGQDLKELRQQMDQLSARLSEIQARVELWTSGVDTQITSLDRYTLQTRRNLVLQEQRLSFILNSLRQSTGSRSEEATRNAVPHLPEHINTMASLYMSFEDAFRGSREEITERLGRYLAELRNAGISPDTHTVIDIGCGRGEWLRLLAENGFQARGCDSNPIMVDQCVAMGLTVANADAIEYLDSLPENSVGAVSAFHVIEHLPLPAMIGLIDSSLRVLSPGGLLILETPNPLNMLVSSHNFHLDPTHLKPLPMQLMQFMVEARGFCNVRTQPLHPYSESLRIREESECAKRFNELFYGPQDYCVLANKI